MTATRVARLLVAVVSTVVVLGVSLPPEALSTGAAAAAPVVPRLKVTSLSVEHLRNPLGLDTPRPRLAWVTATDGRGVRQTAYRVLVSTSRAALDENDGNAWDSGKMGSRASFDVEYQGRPLRSTTRYFWKVRIWDQRGRPSEWSDPAWFETAFMDPADGFTGEWIGRTRATVTEVPEPLLRKEFTAGRPVASARLYIAGLGYHIAYLNGARVGDHEMDPGFTTYSSRVHYVTHDVTSQISEGGNAIGVRLGRGYYADKGVAIASDNHNWTTAPWHSEPKLKLVLAIRYQDGSKDTVVSDTSWVTADGPTTNELPGNEVYDARLANPGWTKAGYDDGDWDAAVSVLPPGGRCDVVDGAPNLPVIGCPGTEARLQAQVYEPQKVTRRFEPVKVTSPAAGVRVYEFPVMTAGWSRIVFAGEAGTTVKIRYSEKLNSDGTAPLQGLSKQEDTYILRGGGPEVYRPSYSYKGFLYVQIASDNMPRVAGISAQQVTTALRATGAFHSSSAQLNAYHRAMKQTSLINLHSIPTDTPTYEKAGWTADAHLFGSSVMRNFGAAALYKKYVQDISDAQLPTGDIPSIAPTPADLSFLLDPGWAAAIVLIPYDLYQTYGDVSAVHRTYPAMARWMSAIETQVSATGYIFNGPVAFGDWVTPANGKVQSAQIHGTAYVYRAATLLAEMARAIGRMEDAARWSTLASRLRASYNARFYDADRGLYLNGQLDTTPLFPEHGTAEPGAYAQTSQVEALAWGLVADDGGQVEVDQQTVLDNLVADVRDKGDHLATGASGTKWLLPVLTDRGHSALAYKVAMNKTYPGWGFWFDMGATTMWETWAEDARSRTHAFLGTVDDWLYTHVAGLRATSPGFRAIDYKPFPGGGLSYASARQATPLGVASSCWQKGPNGDLGLDVVVPVGATGTVYFPGSDASQISEVGQGPRRPAAKAAGVILLRQEGDRVVFRVGSGSYRFVTGRPTACPKDQ